MMSDFILTNELNTGRVLVPLKGLRQDIWKTIVLEYSRGQDRLTDLTSRTIL